MNIWSCKIGEVDAAHVPDGGDLPMRKAVEDAYHRLTGFEPAFTFSGWGAELTENERAVVEDREPEPNPAEAYLGCATTADLLAELHARAELGGYAGYRTIDGYASDSRPGVAPVIHEEGGGA